MEHPKLRDSHKLNARELYPTNEIPDNVVTEIGAHIIYLLALGRKDITGTGWGDTLALALQAIHLDSPVGIADVVKERMAWSAKTIKTTSPLNIDTVRLISGRCSPDYSYGIANPHDDIQKTGRAVLGIWNERINIAQDNYNPIRTSVLIRSNDLSTFTLFEEEVQRYRTSDFIWEVNDNGNLIGKHAETGVTKFTWQPHGSQFTIHTKVPANAIKFKIRKPPRIEKENILKSIAFDHSWITRL